MTPIAFFISALSYLFLAYNIAFTTLPTYAHDELAAVTDTVFAAQNQQSPFTVLENDVYTNSVMVEIIQAPQHGDLELWENRGNGWMTYTPDTDFLGMDTAIYQITDEAGQMRMAELLIEVLPSLPEECYDYHPDCSLFDHACTKSTVILLYCIEELTALVPLQPIEGQTIFDRDSLILTTFIHHENIFQVLFTYENGERFLIQKSPPFCTHVVQRLCDPDCKDADLHVEAYVECINDTTGIVRAEVTGNVGDYRFLAHDHNNEVGAETPYLRPDDTICLDPINYFCTYSKNYHIAVTDETNCTFYTYPDFCPLVARRDTVFTAQNQAHSFTVLENDVYNGTVTVTIIQEPKQGTLIHQTWYEEGEFRYTPNADFLGQDTVIYQLTDAAGNTHTAEVLIVILSPLPNDCYYESFSCDVYGQEHACALLIYTLIECVDSLATIHILDADADIENRDSSFIAYFIVYDKFYQILLTYENGTQFIIQKSLLGCSGQPPCDSDCKDADLFVEAYIDCINDTMGIVRTEVTGQVGNHQFLAYDDSNPEYVGYPYLISGDTVRLNPFYYTYVAVTDETDCTFYAPVQVCPPVIVPDTILTYKNTPITFDPLINDIGPLLSISSVYTSNTKLGTVQYTNTSITYTPYLDSIGWDKMHYNVVHGYEGYGSGEIIIQIVDKDNSCLGEMPADTLILCPNEMTWIEVDTVTLVQEDVLYYIFHSSATNTIGRIFDTSPTGLFNTDFVDIPTQQIVYFSPIVGPDENGDGFPDLESERTHIVKGTPMILQAPKSLQVLDAQVCACENELTTCLQLIVYQEGVQQQQYQVRSEENVLYSTITNTPLGMDTTLIRIENVDVPPNDVPFNLSITAINQHCVFDYTVEAPHTCQTILARGDEADVFHNVASPSINVLTNDRGQQLEVVDMTIPTQGTLNWDINGEVDYLPNSDFIGTENLQYVIKDQWGLMDTAQLIIQVAQQPDLVLRNDSIHLTNSRESAEQTHVFNVFHNDEGYQLHLLDVQATHQNITYFEDFGEVAYRFNSSFIGIDTLTYIVRDYWGRTDSGFVFIHIEQRELTIEYVVNCIDDNYGYSDLQQVEFKIYGGVPPYTISSNYYYQDSLQFNQRYTFMMPASNGACFQPLALLLTDAMGQQQIITEKYSTCSKYDGCYFDNGCQHLINKYWSFDLSCDSTNAIYLYLHHDYDYDDGIDTFDVTDFNHRLYHLTRLVDFYYCIYESYFAIECPPPPISLHTDTIYTRKNTPVTFSLTTDANSKYHNVNSYSNPLHGVAHLIQDDDMIYVPAYQFSGTDSYTYTLTDIYQRTVTGTVYIHVLDEPTPPLNVHAETVCVERNGKCEAYFRMDISGGLPPYTILSINDYFFDMPQIQLIERATSLSISFLYPELFPDYPYAALYIQDALGKEVEITAEWKKCNQHADCSKEDVVILPPPPPSDKQNQANQHSTTLDFRLYPNPAQTVVYLQWASTLSEDAILEVDLYDVLGRQVFTKRGKTTELTSLNIADLTTGIYWIKISHGERHIGKQLVINSQ